MEAARRTSITTRGGVRLVASVITIFMALFALSAPTLAASTDCGCKDTGDYRNPTTKDPAAQELSPHGGVFKLTTAPTATMVTLTIRRVATNDLVPHVDLRPAAVDWGFSPDGNLL